mmetsp:Transcript_7273/g.20523  ORF Transcript_7273/g.20523 Transcript_7273/m.20523 type:complete len:215 (+) Transcript_7273:479-1123(+)
MPDGRPPPCHHPLRQHRPRHPGRGRRPGESRVPLPGAARVPPSGWPPPHRHAVQCGRQRAVLPQPRLDGQSLAEDGRQWPACATRHHPQEGVHLPPPSPPPFGGGVRQRRGAAAGGGVQPGTGGRDDEPAQHHHHAGRQLAQGAGSAGRDGRGGRGPHRFAGAGAERHCGPAGGYVAGWPARGTPERGRRPGQDVAGPRGAGEGRGAPRCPGSG